MESGFIIITIQYTYLDSSVHFEPANKNAKNIIPINKKLNYGHRNKSIILRSEESLR